MATSDSEDQDEQYPGDINTKFKLLAKENLELRRALRSTGDVSPRTKAFEKSLGVRDPTLTGMSGRADSPFTSIHGERLSESHSNNEPTTETETHAAPEKPLRSSPNQANRKRVREEDSLLTNENNPTEVNGETLDPIWAQMTIISQTISDGKNKLNKEARATVMRSLDEIKKSLLNFATSHAAATSRAETLSAVLASQKSITTKLDKIIMLSNLAPKKPSEEIPILRKSYAGVASGGPASKTITMNGYERPLPPLQPTLLFYPTEPEGKTSEELQKNLTSILDPKKDGFQVVKTRKIRGAGIALQTTSPNGLSNIKKVADKLTAKGIKMVAPQGRLPKIVIYDVPKGEPESDTSLFSDIFDNNILGKCNLTKEDHLRTMRRVSLFGKRDSATMNMVITCHPEARKILIDSGLCFLGWNACRARDYLGATRCFKCHQYGHISKACTQEITTCRHCAAAGHDYQDCPVKTQAAVCATCTRFKKPADHATGDRSCPAQKAAIETQVRLTDYGY